jgi:hypothetical protein
MLTRRPLPSVIMERATYFVSTIGESVLTRKSCSIWETGMRASRSIEANARVLTRPKCFRSQQDQMERSETSRNLRAQLSALPQ